MQLMKCVFYSHYLFTMENIHCKKCKTVCRFDLKKRDVDDLGYNLICCNLCYSNVASCLSCPKHYTLRNHDYRNIKKHMKTHENDLDEDVPALVFRSREIDSDDDDDADNNSSCQSPR